MRSSFGAITFVLSVVGIFGVISHSVSQRINEFGLRMALGATPKTIMRLVAREAAKLSLVGVAAGCVASYGLGRAVATLLYGVTATDGATLIGSRRHSQPRGCRREPGSGASRSQRGSNGRIKARIEISQIPFLDSFRAASHPGVFACCYLLNIQTANEAFWGN